MVDLALHVSASCERFMQTAKCCNNGVVKSENILYITRQCVIDTIVIFYIHFRCTIHLHQAYSTDFLVTSLVICIYILLSLINTCKFINYVPVQIRIN